MGRSAARMRAHIVVLALVLLVQTVEHASADAEVSTWDSLPALGETARLEASDQEGSYSSGSTSGLADQLAATDPTVDATATKLTPPTKPDPNALEKELSAMVDANGQSPISGKLEDPKGTTESEVAADKMPALDAKALMAAGKIAAKAAADKLAVANVKFRGIPSLKYGANGVQKEGVTKESCESGCKNDEKCVSYSYSAKTSSCIVSTSLVMYDLEYTFYAKKKQKVEGVAAFRLLGAMKYFSPKGDKSVKAFPGIQLAGCQSNCAKNSDCNSFAYRKGDSTCLTSTQDIKYDPDWSYHEKVGAAELLAIKAKDESGAEPGASAAGKPKGEATPAKDDKAEDKKLEQADESSLSSSQLAILNAKKNTGSTAQAKAILLDGIAAKKALLNTEEQARIQVGKKLKAEADAKAEVENSLEKQGKATFKSDLSATKTKLDKAVAAAEKEGWSNSEKAAKSSEKSRENTQKANQEAAATKLRTKTEDGIALTAQKELEARDAVANIEQRKGLFKEQETHYKGLDNAKVAEIKQNKDAMATAAQTLIESKDTKTLDKYKAEAKAEQQKADDATRAINDKNLQITQIDTKITTLNTDKAAKATDLGNAEGKVKGTEEEIAAETGDALKMPLQKRLVEEKKSEKTMKDQAKVIDDRLAELAEKVTAGNTFIRSTDTKKSQALAAAKAARLAATTEETRLDGLASSGKVAMDDARFRKNQALAAEFKIKSKLADETKAQLKFQESDTKAKLKAKDVKDKLTELEDSKKAQDVEEKIKTSIKFKEIATKKQKKVDDVVKKAKQDELRSVKMLSDGKYAQATAITAEQKVAAAEAVSNANALKATSEQKITALGPAKQAAKEAAAAAADKLDALKALFGSDEAGFKKAMATVKQSDKKLAKEKVNGEVTEAEKLATEKKKLATEAAKLEGANLNKPGAPAGSNVVSAEDKANEIKQKMDKARKNVKDPTAEFLKEKQAKENLATKLKKDQALEKATKTQIAQAEEQAELTQKTEVKQQADEKTGKTKAKAEAKCPQAMMQLRRPSYWSRQRRMKLLLPPWMRQMLRPQLSRLRSTGRRKRLRLLQVRLQASVAVTLVRMEEPIPWRRRRCAPRTRPRSLRLRKLRPRPWPRTKRLRSRQQRRRPRAQRRLQRRELRRRTPRRRAQPRRRRQRRASRSLAPTRAPRKRTRKKKIKQKTLLARSRRRRMPKRRVVPRPMPRCRKKREPKRTLLESPRQRIRRKLASQMKLAPRRRLLRRRRLRSRRSPRGIRWTSQRKRSRRA